MFQLVEARCYERSDGREFIVRQPTRGCLTTSAIRVITYSTDGRDFGHAHSSFIVIVMIVAVVFTDGHFDRCILRKIQRFVAQFTWLKMECAAVVNRVPAF